MFVIVSSYVTIERITLEQKMVIWKVLCLTGLFSHLRKPKHRVTDILEPVQGVGDEATAEAVADGLNTTRDKLGFMSMFKTQSSNLTKSVSR